MIDKRIKILSDHLKDQDNVPWRVIDIENNNTLKKQGKISEAMRLYVKDVLLFKTKDQYETTQN